MFKDLNKELHTYLQSNQATYLTYLSALQQDCDKYNLDQQEREDFINECKFSFDHFQLFLPKQAEALLQSLNPIHTELSHEPQALVTRMLSELTPFNQIHQEEITNVKKYTFDTWQQAFNFWYKTQSSHNRQKAFNLSDCNHYINIYLYTEKY